MTLQITNRPIVNLDGANVSKWSAAFESIRYEGIRKDIVLNGITGSYASDELFVYPKDPLGDDAPVVNGYVYLESGVYQGVYKVTYSDADFFKIEAAYDGDTSGGWFNTNARTNYHVLLALYKTIDNKYIKVTDYIFRPLYNGVFSFDLKLLLSRTIEFKNEFDYLTKNQKDIKLSGRYNFKMREVWQDSNNAWSDFDDRNLAYFVGASKQLKDRHSGNMGEYVPTPMNLELFNNDFSISGSQSGWSLFTASGSGTIANGRLIFSSTNDISYLTATHDTIALVNGIEYDVVVDKRVLENAEVIVIAGTNEVTLNTSLSVEKVSITANGADFAVKLNSTGTGTHRGEIDSVTISKSDINQRAKFLCDAFEPTYFTGFPFDLSFIHSDNIADYEVIANTKYLDINETQLLIDSEALTTGTEFSVNRVIVGDESSFPANTRYIDFWLEIGTSVKKGYTVPGYIAGNGYTLLGIQPIKNTQQIKSQ